MSHAVAPAWRILFLHGRESGPQGSKYRALSAAFPKQVLAPDCTEMPLDQRLEQALIATAELTEPVFVVGSSMGGLVAALLYQAYPERFSGYLLLAPAQHWPEAQKITRVPENALIMAAEQDEIVPRSAIRDWAARTGVHVVWLMDEHRLGRSMPEMMLQVERGLRGEFAAAEL